MHPLTGYSLHPHHPDTSISIFAHRWCVVLVCFRVFPSGITSLALWRTVLRYHSSVVTGIHAHVQCSIGCGVELLRLP
ncbi:uncharacterized protein BDV17DRAFT_255083 [Aspergillus undulatus]|uniref:uncharacterized protein n=1 Tax=Aspergillus undulatus TaxID=1810928 RepID=UPI003CCDF623